MDHTELSKKQRAIARGKIRTVESGKPGDLNIGRHLAAQGVAPPNGANLVTEAHRRSEAVESASAHRRGIALKSDSTSKSCGNFISAFFWCGTVAITLIVIFQSPRGREWPATGKPTDFSINADQFERADLARRCARTKHEMCAGSNFFRRCRFDAVVEHVSDPARILVQYE